MSVPPISGEIQYVTPDGRLTYLGISLLQDIATGVSDGMTAASWGNIIGSLIDQIDLQLEFDTKQPIGDYATGAQGDLADTAVQPTELADGLATKQDTLVSGTNIKTIGGISVLGAGDLTVPGTMNHVILASDVVNSNAVANTLQDVTGLDFSVVAGETYWFEVSGCFDAAATTTGSRWTLNGPATTHLAYSQQFALTATSYTNGNQVAYQQPAAAAAGSAYTNGNMFILRGLITPSASGTVQLQFASGVSTSAITAKAGSLLMWKRVL